MSTLQYCIDRIDFQRREGESSGVCLHLAGWIYDSAAAIEKVTFSCAGEDYPIVSFGGASPDVGSIFGAEAGNCRFEEVIETRGFPRLGAFSRAVLRVMRSDGTSVEAGLGGPTPWSWAVPRGDFASFKARVAVLASDPEELEQQLAAIADLSLWARAGVVVGEGPHDVLEKIAHKYNSPYIPKRNDGVVSAGVLAAFYLRNVMDSDIILLLDRGLPQIQNWDQNWILGALSFGSVVHTETENAKSQSGADGAWWRPYRVAPSVMTCCLAFSRTDIDYYGLPQMRTRAFGATSQDEESVPEVYAFSESIHSLGTASLDVSGGIKECGSTLSSEWRNEIQSAVLSASLPGEISFPLLNPPEDKILFSRFISFGDNCEFGLVQRKIGLETLDLLRFGGTGDNQEGLLRALQEDFRAFGSPEDVHIYEVGGEWISGSQRYGVTFHTHRHVKDTERDDVQASEQTKLKYLARKLLEDLEDGEKIIVRKSNRGITVDEMRSLLQGVRRYGDCPLLIVSEATDNVAINTVRALGNGLFHGTIRRLAPYENAGGGSVEDWRQICCAMIAQLEEKGLN
ncbi:MAG: hypothetical protein ABF617_13665 [Gluconobacter japonicus]|uniref:hypothetical protein n=1 Tax=Gluconobacter japonicus TaxID=376620 RepID=UPI0039EB653B